MRAITIARHKLSGELYKFVRRQEGTNSVLEYYYAKPIKITAGLDKNNRMTIRCSEPLAIGFLIKDIKDQNGNLILSDSIWQINSIQPVINAFNAIDSYTMKAIKYQGTL